MAELGDGEQRAPEAGDARSTMDEDSRVRALLAHVEDQIGPPPTDRTTRRGCVLAIVGLVVMIGLALYIGYRGLAEMGTGIGNAVGGLGQGLDEAFGCFGSAMSPEGCASSSDVPSATVTGWTRNGSRVCAQVDLGSTGQLDAGEWKLLPSEPNASQSTGANLVEPLHRSNHGRGCTQACSASPRGRSRRLRSSGGLLRPAAHGGGSSRPMT